MANTKSAKKAARQMVTRTAVNKNRRSAVKSEVRKVEEAIASGNKDAAATALQVRPACTRSHRSEGRDASEDREPQGVAPGSAHQGDGVKTGVYPPLFRKRVCQHSTVSPVRHREERPNNPDPLIQDI